MFDNIISQSSTELLRDDILKNKLPGSILFYGPAASGKFSCALETARVLSCEEKGDWTCTCSSCLKHKALVSQNVLITGPGNKILEINAAKNTLLIMNIQNSRHLEASRYLFIRAVRKLTSRFSPVLWEGEDKLAKFSPLLVSINDNLELIQPGRVLPDDSDLRKIVDSIVADCEKLESTYLYDSLPVSQIRNFSSWAHMTSGSSSSGKKIIIIENADQMLDGSKNALLKILEEPPRDTMFILTTTQKGAMLPTILSRLRTYSFVERTVPQQQDLIQRVFHTTGSVNGEPCETINDFLQTYLPVSPDAICAQAEAFFKKIAEGRIPDVPALVTACCNFEPRTIFKIFLQGIVEVQKEHVSTGPGAETSAELLKLLRHAWNSVTVYNQNPAAVLEELTRSIMQLNFLNNGILRGQKSE
ncbi:DNA polymerase III [Treponema sp.]|uniref:DNA polymerase III n=1 Tax=Treponema sp. TaxID=166 RepID=UPI00298E813C|nr:DNA polymerase III [Treponema sp.]MCQ2242517.1 DNA polymerase III [Treponema sp.]